MEKEIHIEPQIVSVNGSELLKNLNQTKTNTILWGWVRNLIIFLDLFQPKEIGFDSHCFLQVLSGKKGNETLILFIASTTRVLCGL